MKPRPPTWTSPTITACPKPLQWVPVSTTARPVTVTAEVAVNAAASGEVGAPGWVAHGSISSSVPVEMTIRNPDTT